LARMRIANFYRARGSHNGFLGAIERHEASNSQSWTQGQFRRFRPDIQHYTKAGQ